LIKSPSVTYDSRGLPSAPAGSSPPGLSVYDIQSVIEDTVPQNNKYIPNELEGHQHVGCPSWLEAGH
jgi:hypothetical protein